MTQQDFKALTRTVPFVPFRVHLSNGEQYDIHHPDMILANYGSVSIGLPENHPLGMSFRLVSMNHVVKVESLQVPASADGSGTGKAK